MKAIMTVFRAQPFDGDYGRAMMVEDERSGEIWEEPIRGWSEIWEVDYSTTPETVETEAFRATCSPCQRYYRHTDGRIALPAT